MIHASQVHHLFALCWQTTRPSTVDLDVVIRPRDTVANQLARRAVEDFAAISTSTPNSFMMRHVLEGTTAISLHGQNGGLREGMVAMLSGSIIGP